MGSAAVKRAQDFDRDKIFAQVVQHYDELLSSQDPVETEGAPFASAVRTSEGGR